MIAVIGAVIVPLCAALAAATALIPWIAFAVEDPHP